MSGTFACDISSWQRPVDDTYPHPWLIFRACDGTYRDPNFPANLNWAKANAGKKLVGYTVYAVYEPGVDILAVVKSMVGTPDPYLTVMIDVESWSGKIQGDHSADITAVYRAFAAWLGDERRVIVYGNQGDLANLYPHRPPAEHLIIAAYGSVKPNVPGQIGWQYSDGQSMYPVPAGWPRATSPFGPADHNHFDLDPAALAAELGVGDVTAPSDVWGFNIPSDPGGTTAAHRLFQANLALGSLNSAVSALSAQVAALAAAVAKIQSGGGSGAAPTAFTGTVNLVAKP